MMTSKEIRQANLKYLLKTKCQDDKSKLAQKLGYDGTTYTNGLLNGHNSFGNAVARKIEKSFDLVSGAMDVLLESQNNTISQPDFGHNSPVFYSVNEVNDKDESYEIEYYKSRGSCGGGFMNGDDELLGSLVKEASWFNHFGVKPQNCKAIYADGDSMSDFIVDGDMVLFDISKTTPISGKIFLLRYPEGLRIKELQETVSGKWKIKSRNKSFDDEEIAASDDIEIIGQFIYRQGGI